VFLCSIGPSPFDLFPASEAVTLRDLASDEHLHSFDYPNGVTTRCMYDDLVQASSRLPIKSPKVTLRELYFRKS